MIFLHVSHPFKVDFNFYSIGKQNCRIFVVCVHVNETRLYHTELVSYTLFGKDKNTLCFSVIPAHTSAGNYFAESFI